MTLCDIANRMTDTFTAIELFAGCGGLALGLFKANIVPIQMVENNPDCIKTLEANFPWVPFVNGDIRDINFEGARADVVSGGFPCQAFSQAGKKRGFADERGNLFFEYLRAIREIKPRAIITENVPGLLTHANGESFQLIIESFESLGYEVQHRILNANDYGVPQNRKRLIVIAKHESVAKPITFPAPCLYKPVLEDAIRYIMAGEGAQYSEAKKKIMEMIPEGGCWRDLPEEIQREYMGKSFYSSGGRTGIAKRLAWYKPSPTLTCSPNQKQTERCHPTETRPLSIREYAKIQTFPDWFKFHGSLYSQYRQIGNAVPVMLAERIGQCVHEMLTC